MYLSYLSTVPYETKQAPRSDRAAALREHQILREVIRAFAAGEDAPTYRSLAKTVGLRSPSNTHKYVKRLLARGVVVKGARGGVRPLIQATVEARGRRARNGPLYSTHKEGVLTHA